MKHISLFNKLSLITLILLTILGGCTTTPVSRLGTLSEKELIGNAQEAEQQGKHETAARYYLGLADISEGKSRTAYQLKAINVFLNGNFIEEAKRVLKTTSPDKDNAEHLALQRILTARIAIAEQDLFLALKTLNQQVPAKTPPNLKSDILALLSRVYLRSGDPLRSTQALVQRDFILSDSGQIKENHLAIWQNLLSIPYEQLITLKLAPNNELSGWIELAIIEKSSLFRPINLESEMSNWRQRYPEHRVIDEIVASLLARQEDTLFQPRNITLILPFSGNYAKAAAALRDGFMAAFYNRSNSGYQPTINIVDAGNDVQQINDLYDQAIKNGSDFIIGPLRKESVHVLAKRSTLPVPVLTLNYSEDPGDIAENLFQFGLSPEDEARQIAERAWLDGHNQALAIIPEGDWGNRIVNAFQENWKLFGGTIVEQQSYPLNNNDFSKELQQLLNIDESYSRFKKLKRLTREDIKFTPRRRQDADFVFMAAFPRQGRLIRPQLKFHYASDLPVYSTSHIYTGTKNRNADRDMDGVIFCDIPWVLNPSQSTRHIQKMISDLWDEPYQQFTRFYAMGIDTYNIIPKLKLLKIYPHERFSGHTGILSLTESNRIFREVQWAKIKNGIPRTL